MQETSSTSFALQAAMLFNQGKLQDLEPSLQLNLLQVINAHLDRSYGKFGELQEKISFECVMIFGEWEEINTLDEISRKTHWRRLVELDQEEKSLIADIKLIEEAVEALEGRRGKH
jgi:hypothetical protein